MTIFDQDLGDSMRAGNGKRVVLLNALLAGLLGMGQVVAEGTSTPTYPNWAQPSQQPSTPAPGQDVPPPPGPYGGLPAGDGQAAPFAPPAMQWQSPAQGRGGMTREEFLNQQTARREAMEKQMAAMREHQQQQMQQQGAINQEMDAQQKQWRAEHEKRVQQQAAQQPKAMTREEMDKQMQAMRAQHEQRVQQQKLSTPADHKAEMDKRTKEMRERHQAHWKAMQDKEQEVEKLFEQMRAKEQEMRKLFDEMRAEHEKRMATAGYPAPATPEQQAAAQPRSAQPRMPGMMPPMPVYPYRAPYGYYPGQVRPYAAPVQ